MSAAAEIPILFSIASAVEKPLLKLHSATDVMALWRAVESVVNTVLPGSFVGLTLQHNPIQPMVEKWTQLFPDSLFESAPLRNYLASHPRIRIVRSSDLFPKRAQLTRSDFYRQYMAPRHRAHVIGLLFWRSHRLICVIVIMRTARQGDFTNEQMRLLRRLYPQFQAALRRLGSLERERSARVAFEEFLRRLPLPTLLLRWNLKLVYQNQAAREFCTLWQMGPDRASVLKADLPIPNEILAGCRELKRRWQEDQHSPSLAIPATLSWKALVHHPEFRHLRANLTLKQISSLGVVRPHFLIECENLMQSSQARGQADGPRLSHLTRLSRREQQVSRLVCHGRSNQEIADEAKLSVAMVKKHLHSIFRKLEITSRSRLITLMQ